MTIDKNDILKYRHLIGLNIKNVDTWVSENSSKILKKRKYGEKITLHHKNIAAALQLRIEEIIITQLRLKNTELITSVYLAD